MRFLRFELFLVAATLFAAENPFLGVWKLNPAKSKSSPMPVPQSMTVKFEADADKVRRTVTGVDGQGKPIMQSGPEGTSVAWDGKIIRYRPPKGRQ
jgi:NAD kinase